MNVCVANCHVKTGYPQMLLLFEIDIINFTLERSEKQTKRNKIFFYDDVILCRQFVT